ncbi:DUF6734 family protein [Sphingobacterium faecium]|uniref:DUF6734 family protein n=1 Tax=Sphingobacterium faecium TaxID=34087 RepID=UPI00320A21B4
MRIIQSLWTKPILNYSIQSEHGRFSGGWLETRYNLMSWSLSCLQLLKFYDEVELYTDRLGKHLLIDILQLPYSKVHLVFDSFDEFNTDLWALGKVFVYGLQKSPFIHVDGDVYIGERFPSRIEKASLVAQNVEKGYSLWYPPLMDNLKKQGVIFPDIILDVIEREGEINAYNAGIIGGNDTDFYRCYSKASLEFVMSNICNIDKTDIGGFNTIYEQNLFYSLAVSKKMPVNSLFETENKEELDDNVRSFTSFHQFPHISKYIHLYGVECKRNEKYCDELSVKLRTLYPEFHSKIESLTPAMS